LKRESEYEQEIAKKDVLLQQLTEAKDDLELTLDETQKVHLLALIALLALKRSCFSNMAPLPPQETASSFPYIHGDAQSLFYAILLLALMNTLIWVAATSSCILVFNLG
jgi:hypothetical protein